MKRSIWILMFIISLAHSITKTFADDMIPMPKGLEGVYLGMSLDSFKKVKPNIVKDDWPYSTLYFEKDFKNDFFSTSVYDFSNNKLSEITLEKSGAIDFIQNKIPGIVNGSIKKWGKNYSKKIGIGEDIKNKIIRLYPVYYWEKADAKIILTYSLKTYSIRILDIQQKVTIKFREPEDLKELEEVFKNVPITENYNGPIFE